MTMVLYVVVACPEYNESGNAENLIDFIKNEQHRRKKWFNQK